MKLLKFYSFGWQFNEGGRFITAGRVDLQHGARMYRLWAQGVELLCLKNRGCWPRFAIKYRRVLLWRD